MPNEFDPELQINGEGRIVPAGPMELEAGEEVSRLYAWVVQTNHDGTATICSGFQDDFPDTDRWVARADAYHAGRFQKGLALATAVLIVRNQRRGLGGSPDDPGVYWWSATVVLKP